MTFILEFILDIFGIGAKCFNESFVILLSGICVLSNGHPSQNHAREHKRSTLINLMIYIFAMRREIFVSPTKHNGTYSSLCPASVCPSVYLVVTFLVVMLSFVSHATHAFLGILPSNFKRN